MMFWRIIQDEILLKLVHRMLPLWYNHREPTESDSVNVDESMDSTEEAQSEAEDQGLWHVSSAVVHIA